MTPKTCASLFGAALVIALLMLLTAAHATNPVAYVTCYGVRSLSLNDDSHAQMCSQKVSLYGRVYERVCVPLADARAGYPCPVEAAKK